MPAKNPLDRDQVKALELYDRASLVDHIIETAMEDPALNRYDLYGFLGNIRARIQARIDITTALDTRQYELSPPANQRSTAS